MSASKSFIFFIWTVGLCAGHGSYRKSSILIAPFSQATPLTALYLPATQEPKCLKITARLTHYPEEHQQVNLTCRRRNKGTLSLRGIEPGSREKKLTVESAAECKHHPLSAVVEADEIGTNTLPCRVTSSSFNISLSNPKIDKKNRLNLKITLNRRAQDLLPVTVLMLATGEVVSKSIKTNLTTRNIRLQHLPPEKDNLHILTLARSNSGEITATVSVLSHKGNRVTFSSSSGCEEFPLKDVLKMAGLQLIADPDDSAVKPSLASEATPAVTSTFLSLTTPTTARFPAAESLEQPGTCGKCPDTSCKDRLGTPFLEEQDACDILRYLETFTDEKQDNKELIREEEKKFDVAMNRVVSEVLIQLVDKWTGQESVKAISRIKGLLKPYLPETSPGTVKLPLQKESVRLTSMVARILCMVPSSTDSLLKYIEMWLDNDTVSGPPQQTDDVIEALLAVVQCKTSSARIKGWLQKFDLKGSSDAKLAFLNTALHPKGEEEYSPLHMEELHCPDTKWTQVQNENPIEAAFRLRANLNMKSTNAQDCACLAKRLHNNSVDLPWMERLETTLALDSYVQWLSQRTLKLNFLQPNLNFSVQYKASLQINVINSETLPSPPSSPSPPSLPPPPSSPPPSSSPSPTLPAHGSSIVCPSISIDVTPYESSHQKITTTMCSYGQNLDVVLRTFPHSYTHQEGQNLKNFNANHSGFVHFNTNNTNCSTIVSIVPVHKDSPYYEPPFLAATDPATKATCRRTFSFVRLGQPSIPRTCLRSGESENSCCCTELREEKGWCWGDIHLEMGVCDESDLDASLVNWVNVKLTRVRENESFKIWTFEILGIIQSDDITNATTEIQYLTSSFCHDGGISEEHNYTLVVPDPLRFSISPSPRHFYYGGKLVYHNPSENTSAYMERCAVTTQVSRQAPKPSIGRATSNSLASRVVLTPVLMYLLSAARLTFDL